MFAGAGFELSRQFDIAGQDDAKTVPHVAYIEQGLPCLIRANVAETTDPFDLPRRQENGYPCMHIIYRHG
jgi:hypothetical protein